MKSLKAATAWAKGRLSRFSLRKIGCRDQVDKVRALEPMDVASRGLAHPRQCHRGRVFLYAREQGVDEDLLEVVARQRFDRLRDHCRRQLLEPEAHHIDGRPDMDKGDFRGAAESNAV